MVIYEVRLEVDNKWVSIGEFNRLQTKELVNSYIKNLVNFQVRVVK